jgi:hypothetical protein
MNNISFETISNAFVANNISFVIFAMMKSAKTLAAMSKFIALMTTASVVLKPLLLLAMT